MVKEASVRLRILRFLLTGSPDKISVREIARQLGLSPSHVHYHLNKMYDLGVLSREQAGDRVNSFPQKIFVEDVDETLKLLKELSEKLDEPRSEILANCIVFFLKIHDGIV